MGLYKRKDSPFWWMSFRVDGRRIREATGTVVKKLAERIHAQRLTELAERAIPRKRSRRPLLISASI